MDTPVLFKTGGTGVADNDVVHEVDSNAESFSFWQLGSTAGAMDVFGSLDGVNYLTAPLAMVDLGSTAPSTAVTVTVANGHYGIRGRFRKIKVLQNGATAVAGATLEGYS